MTFHKSWKLKGRSKQAITIELYKCADCPTTLRHRVEGGKPNEENTKHH